MSTKTRWDHSDRLLETSTCNDCSSNLSCVLGSQDSKYSNEQSKIKEKIFPPCRRKNTMNAFLWLCCPQRSPAGPCSEGHSSSCLLKVTLHPFSLPKPRAGAQMGQRWSQMAPGSGQLWHNGDWTHPPTGAGWDLRLRYPGAGKYPLLFHGVRQKSQSRE